MTTPTITAQLAEALRSYLNDDRAAQGYGSGIGGQTESDAEQALAKFDAAQQAAGEKALQFKTVCPFCESEWVTGEQHDANLAAHRVAQSSPLPPLPVPDEASDFAPGAKVYPASFVRDLHARAAQAAQPLPVLEASGKLMLSLADLGVLAATAERNGTGRQFVAVAMQWAGQAHEELLRLRAAIPQPAPEALQGEPTVKHSALAGMILTHLGYSTAPSLEPRADARRDVLAEKLAGWLNTDSQQPAQAVPLTWEQFKAACEVEYGEEFCPNEMKDATEDEKAEMLRVVRIVERAHGIGVKLAGGGEGV